MPKIRVVDDWAVTVPTKTPTQRASVVGPQKRRSPRILLGGYVVLLALALTAGAVLLRGGAEKFDDEPGQPLAALTGPYTVQDPVFGQSYTLELPEPPRTGAAASSPTTFGSMGTAKISAGTFLLFVRLEPDLTDARSAVDAVQEGEFAKAISDVRRTKVGGAPGFARDFAIGDDGRRLREFRFVHAGTVYGIGLLYGTGDERGLNTALAAVQSLRWTS